jgi:hypothetical protein
MKPKTLSLGLPLTIYQLAKCMLKNGSVQAEHGADLLLIACDETQLVTRQQLNIIAESIGSELRWTDNAS